MGLLFALVTIVFVVVLSVVLRTVTDKVRELIDSRNPPPPSD